MPFQTFMTGVKFKKNGREVKIAIGQRIAELRRRLSKRDGELDEVMGDKVLLRSYLVRERRNDFPQPSSQITFELPTEEHQRITELCHRIQAIELEITELSIVRDNLNDDQELELSFDDLTTLGFSREH